MPDLEITAVRVVPVAEPGEGYEVRVSLENRSAHIVYVVSTVRGLRLDPATGVLYLSWQEPAPAPGGPYLHFFVPALQPIRAGGTADLTAILPPVIEALHPDADRGFRVERTEIPRDIVVACTVAYGNTPPRPKARGTYDEARRALHEWGSVAVGRSKGSDPDSGNATTAKGHRPHSSQSRNRKHRK
jgi:hypothetical protein